MRIAKRRPGLSRIWRFIGPNAWLWELSLLAWLLLGSYLLSIHGRLDWTGHALGRDFVNYWTAGHLVLEGRTREIFQPELFLGHEHRLFDARLPFHFWSYPPPALFLVAPLGLTSYVAGLVLWSLAGLAVLFVAVRLWTPEAWARWMIVLAPAAPTNIGLGQNGGFTAALLIASLMLIERRPRLSGALMGLLIFKPQLGILLPVAVVASRRWKVLASAALTALALVVASALVFGPPAWTGFLGPTLQTQTTMLRQGHGPFQWMMPSAYMAGRVLHLPWMQAALVQLPFTLLGTFVVWRVWSRPAARGQDAGPVPLQLQAAIVMTATFVVSPQAFNYDLIPTAAAALWLWRNDPRTWIGWPLAMAIWALPVVMMGLQYIHVAVAPLVLTALLLRLWALTPRDGRSRSHSILVRQVGKGANRDLSLSTASQFASNT